VEEDQVTPALLDRIATSSTLYQPARRSPALREAQNFYERGAPAVERSITIEPFDDNVIWLTSFMQDRLNELLRLPDGWDGYRANAVDLHAALGAADVALTVGATTTLPPQVFPLANGGIQLEWHAAGQSVEIEIDPGGEAHILAVASDGTELINEDLLDDPNLVREAGAVLREIAAKVTRAR
jgi:hypothetical protein